jgi:hypothetical protein
MLSKNNGICKDVIASGLVKILISLEGFLAGNDGNLINILADQ